MEPNPIDSLNRLAECSVNPEPMKRQVSLFPCVHKIEESIAHKLFEGVFVDNSWWKATKKGTCPECPMLIFGYRAVVEQVSLPKPEDVQKSVMSVKENLSNHSVPYPNKIYGTRGNFLPKDMIFFYTLEDSTRKAAIYKIILEDKYFIIFFEKYDRNFAEYLHQIWDIKITNIDIKNGSFYTKNPTEIGALKDMLKSNNDFDPEALDLLQKYDLKRT